MAAALRAMAIVGASCLRRLGRVPLAGDGAARLAADGGDLMPRSPRHFPNHEGGHGAAHMPSQTPDPAAWREGLKLSEAFHAWGPADLVAEVKRLGPLHCMIFLIGLDKPPDPLEARKGELERLVNDWFRAGHASGRLRFRGVPSRGDASWEEVPRELADDLDYWLDQNSVSVGKRRWDYVKAWREGPAVTPQSDAPDRLPLSGTPNTPQSHAPELAGVEGLLRPMPDAAPQADKTTVKLGPAAGPRGYRRFDEPLALELIERVDKGEYSSDWRAALENESRAKGERTGSAAKRLLRAMKELRESKAKLS